MALLDFFNNQDGKREVGHGSDGRLNVTSRSDERIYYNSRDESDAYTALWDDANASAGDYVFYLKNTNTKGQHLVIHSSGLNCEAASASFKMVTITDTPSGGAAITPACLNRAAPKAAAVTCLGPTDSSSAPMTATPGVELDHAGATGAYGHQEFRIQDSIRLGQDQAVGIELEHAAAADVRCFGVIFFYFE